MSTQRSRNNEGTHHIPGECDEMTARAGYSDTFDPAPMSQILAKIKAKKSSDTHEVRHGKLYSTILGSNESDKVKETDLRTVGHYRNKNTNGPNGETASKIYSLLEKKYGDLPPDAGKPTTYASDPDNTEPDNADTINSITTDNPRPGKVQRTRSFFEGQSSKNDGERPKLPSSATDSWMPRGPNSPPKMQRRTSIGFERYFRAMSVRW